MTGCLALKPSYLVLSSSASISHSWRKKEGKGGGGGGEERLGRDGKYCVCK